MERHVYGTAGFRMKAHKLPLIAHRMGCLAALRSLSLLHSQEREDEREGARVGGEIGVAVGIMVTASHNPEEDNGVKIADYNGEMVSPVWEEMATEVANECEDSLPTLLRRLSVNVCGGKKGEREGEGEGEGNGEGGRVEGSDGEGRGEEGVALLLAWDTRPSSLPLAQHVAKGSLSLSLSLVTHTYTHSHSHRFKYSHSLSPFLLNFTFIPLLSH